jgi:pimeloyl-ACP methyl ester carboxylesterase
VLIDAGHERQFEVLGGRPSPVLLAGLKAVPAVIATGLPALVQHWVPTMGGDVLPPEAARAVRALTVMDGKMAQAALAEMQALETSMAQVADARAAAARAQPLQDLPLVVLMKGQAEAIPGLALSAQEQQDRWRALQSDLAGQSRQGQLIVAERSGHNIPYQQPDLVLAAIARVFAASGSVHAN